MEIELALGDFFPAFANLAFRALDPDTFEILEREDVKDGIHVIVELVDRLVFEAVGLGMEIDEFDLIVRAEGVDVGF